MKSRLKTGLKEVDNFIGGIGPGELVVIGGRPGMGIQTLALTMMVNMRNDFQACYLSLDTSAEYIDHQIRGQFAPDPPAFSPVLAELDTVNILPEAAKTDHLVFRLAQRQWLPLIETIIQINMHCNPDYFIIDRLEDMGEAIPRLYSKSKSYREVLRQFKVLARALNKPLILLAGMHPRMDKKKRLRRGMEYYASKERIADVLFLPFRPFYYGIEKDEYDEPINSDHLALIIRRSGGIREIGRVDLRMDFVKGRVEEGSE